MRKWLAKKLAPDMFDKARRYDRLQLELAESHRWLGHDSPDIAAFIERIWSSEKWFWHRGLPLLPQPKWRVEIEAFREQLREKHREFTPDL
jgi:hypothetical protein